MTHEELVRLTKATLEPYAGHPLSDAEAEECIQNMTALLKLLHDLQENSDSPDTPVDPPRGGRAGEPALDKSS